jgi:two-component system, NtrC family, sensor kinase
MLTGQGLTSLHDQSDSDEWPLKSTASDAANRSKRGLFLPATRPSVPPIRAAVAHINQVFLDLLRNGVDAIEAAGRGAGRIEVATQHLHGEILIEISDNGTGISPTDLSRIFDPFFTTKAPGKGTGLGLSVCQRGITEHGGRIELDSKPETGTCFRILLPVDGPF